MDSDTLNFLFSFWCLTCSRQYYCFLLQVSHFFNLNFYTLLAICFEFYIKRTDDINSLISLSDKSFTYDNYKTNWEIVWVWACFPYHTDSFWCKNFIYIYSVHLTLEIKLLLVQGTPDCQSQRNEPLSSQIINMPLPCRGMFSKLLLTFSVNGVTHTLAVTHSKQH